MQHTLGHVECPACDQARMNVMFLDQFGDLLFTAAARIWLDSRRNKLKASTIGHYEDYVESLENFFGAMKLREIHIGHINQYQKERQAVIRLSAQHRHAKRGRGHDNSDGASRVNHEISALAQILKRAALWSPIAEFYEALPLPKDSPGIALEEEEEQHIFEVASSNPRWLIAYCCDLISNATAMGPKEIQHIQLGDIDHEARTVLVRSDGAKNEFRLRRVPLNDDAWWAVETLLEKARKKGASRPDHYLLPHRAVVPGGPADPTRPMGSWKKAHYAIRKEAAKKCPRLATLRRYDFRHNATTKMLENPEVSERTIEEMVGHRLGSKVKERYSHIRLQARRQAALVLQGGHARSVVKKPSRSVPIPLKGGAHTAAV